MQHTLEDEYILDANVLIDYSKSDLSVVAAFATRVKACFVGRSVLEEVKQITDAQAKKIHIEILTPDIEMVEKSARLKGPLSPFDWETYFLAKKHELTCVSSDTNLRRECTNSGVAVMWGLEPMKILVAGGVLSVSKATAVALKIRESNHYIKAETIELFESQIIEIAKNPKRES